MAGSPGSFRPRELEIVKVLLDKHLLERAVNLAEARWAGSGEMVRLAYRWEELSPADRRQELERLGPEVLAQYRPMADLNPDLAIVLGTLEQRGVLPGKSQAPEEPVDPAPSQPDEESLQPSTYAAARQTPPPPPVDAEPVIEPVLPPTASPAMRRDLQERIERLSKETLIDSGAGYAAAESMQYSADAAQQRRAEAVAQGEQLLDRVRSRLDTTSRQAASASTRITASSHQLPRVDALAPSMVTSQPTDTSIVVGSPEPSLPPDYWAKRLKDEQVVILDADTHAPSDDELVALANEFDLELSEFVIAPGTTRALFGGLKRSGTAVDVQVGPLPYALANPQLVVVRGRLFPSIEEGLRRGVVDIPGTRACVQMDARARLIVVP